jgi:drug/metabolite transporter (DMT)-like permease
MQLVSSKKSLPRSVVIGLTLAIALDTAVQFSWKFAASGINANYGLLNAFWQAMIMPSVWLTILLFILQFVNWMKVLAKADLSFAQPITALSYVSVSFLSCLYLHESMNFIKAAGIALILLGVYFVTQSDHDTSAIACEEATKVAVK